MPQRDVSAWDVISQQLPQWWADHQTKDLREGIQSVVPTTPLDLGMMMLGGPTGGMAKKVGAGLIAAGTGDAEAGNFIPAILTGAKKHLPEFMLDLRKGLSRSELFQKYGLIPTTLDAVDVVQHLPTPPQARLPGPSFSELSAAKLSDFLNHPQLYEQSPSLKNLPVISGGDKLGTNSGAYFGKTTGEVLPRSGVREPSSSGLEMIYLNKEPHARGNIVRHWADRGITDVSSGNYTVLDHEVNHALQGRAKSSYTPHSEAEWQDRLQEIFASIGAQDAPTSKLIAQLDQLVPLSALKGAQLMKYSPSNVGSEEASYAARSYFNRLKNKEQLLADELRFKDGGHVEHTRSSGQDASTQPVDSQWRAALRSYLAGTAGLPGDLEGLGRQGINAAFGLGGVKVDETPVLPTTDFYKDWLPGKQEGSAPLADAASMLGGAGMLKGIRSVESLGKAIAHAAPGPVAGGKLAQLGVIRNTGDNNFLKGSVENALKGLRRTGDEERAYIQFVKDNVSDSGYSNWLSAKIRENPDFQKVSGLDAAKLYAKESGIPMPVVDTRETQVNKFVEGPLTRYVKNQMATPDDPVRALAEQGVLHVSPESLPTGYTSQARAMRSHVGMDPKGAGRSEAAKLWENASDPTLSFDSAGHWAQNRKVLDNNSWLSDAPADKRIFQTDSRMASDLGFTHLTDELRNALNPESGLPRNLLLTPEKLQNFGMERAVRHVAAINDWRAAQVAEANAQRANNAATVLHKEYPHTPETPNPKGLRWVELKAPEYKELPAGISVEEKPYQGYTIRRLLDAKGEPMGSGWFGHPGQTSDPVEIFKSFHQKDTLQDALKYEGDTMKHCVGGYCDDVLSGKKRIFSLRDAKGEPHVTIHTEPSGPRADPRFDAGVDFEDQAHTDIRRAQPKLDPDSEDYMYAVQGRAQDLAAEWNAKQQAGQPDRIVQIKRKANLVSSEPYEYRPFVQDFVKSGKWSDVGDMANTGLRKTSDAFNDFERAKIQEAGHTLGEYITPEDVSTIGNAVWPGNYGPPLKFATGGRVSMIHPAAAIQPLVRVPGFDRF